MVWEGFAGFLFLRRDMVCSSLCEEEFAQGDRGCEMGWERNRIGDCFVLCCM
jgi:hypothetical protein